MTNQLAAQSTPLRDSLKLAKSLISQGQSAQALVLLRNHISPESDFVVQSRAARLLAKLPQGTLGLRPLRVALLASTTVDHLVDLLRLWLALCGIEAEIYLAPYDTMEQTVLDPSSPLYSFKPQLVWLFSVSDDVELATSPNATSAQINTAVLHAVERREQLWRILQDRLSCQLLQNNAELPVDDPFGQMAGTQGWGRRSLLRAYNSQLAIAAPAGVAVFDLDHLSAYWGSARWRDPRLWFHAKHAFCQDATGLVASHAARSVAAQLGLSRKCLILDLDNTLWGGVIGDDGVAGIVLGDGAEGEAFVAFQDYIKALRERGIVLAVCSKNEMTAAQLPFESHPDMRLTLDDFAVFRANWADKASNIRAIAKSLSLGLDALVFVDDNPAERELIRQQLPMVQVIDLPDDPTLYVQSLARAGCFEASSISAEDSQRADNYADNARREDLRLETPDLSKYLESLQMRAQVRAADDISLPRIAQLINKSNQFHLTGLRLSEPELLALDARDDYQIIGVRLTDRFGDNGLVSAVLLHHHNHVLQVDAWVMSCRVLGRTLEEFVANEIVNVAKHRGCRQVVGRYVASPKNALVANLYSRLGFGKLDDDWVLGVRGPEPRWQTPIAGQSFHNTRVRR